MVPRYLLVCFCSAGRPRLLSCNKVSVEYEKQAPPVKSKALQLCLEAGIEHAQGSKLCAGVRCAQRRGDAGPLRSSDALRRLGERLALRFPSSGS